MRVLTLVCLLCHAFTGKTKLDALRKKKNSENGIVFLGTNDYKEYVVQQPRPYTVFVMLTGSTKKFPQLKMFDDAFTRMSESYMHGYAGDADRPVFFVIVDTYTYRDVSLLHNVKSVPFIAHIGSDMWRNESDEVFAVGQDDTFAPSRNTDAKALLAWANEFMKVDVEEFVSQSEKVTDFLLVVWAVVVLTASAVIAIQKIRQHPILMVAGAFVIHGIAIGGFFSNLLSQAGLRWGPPHRAFFVPGGRHQYLREGLLVAITTLVPSICLILVINARKFVDGGLHDWKTVQFGLILMAMLASHGLLVCFKVKSQWYDDPPFFGFSNMKTGSIHQDQGNTLLD